MPRNDCCAPGCSNKIIDGIPLHYFPNPDTDTERFHKWVNIIGGNIVDLDSSTIYKSYRVCRQHFDNVFLYPRNRLCKLAVPFLPSVVLAASSAPLDQPSTSCDDTLIPSVTEKPTQTCIKFRVHSSDTYLKRKSNENRVKKLQLNLQHCLKAKQTYYKRYLLAKKLSRSKAIEILTKQMSPAAKTLFCMQIKGSKVEPRGRRFTINEKILALSLYKPSPKAYRMLSQVCVLPSRRTLQNLLQKVDLVPGINENIFEHMKKKVSKMPKRYKLCSVLFDEMSIAPSLHYDKAHDCITGFIDNGCKRELLFADHALVFMVRGIVKKYKQPVAYSFCSGTTKTADLKYQLCNVIKKVESTGLKVVATVCDQGVTNVAALNQLMEETKEKYLRNSVEYKGGFFEVENSKVIPIYDPPHLIKGVRNNLLNKNLKYIKDGKVRVAKWSHIQNLFLRSPSFRGVKLVHKLTAQHVIPEMIPKMKVKYCTQVFSQSVGVALGFLAECGTLPEESVDTADILMLFDNLFDSVNANFHKEEGKIYRSAVTQNSPHKQFWNSVLPILKSMRFINKDEKEVIVPSLTSWVKTIEAFKIIINDLRLQGINSVLLRNINQDPLENFFGAIRAHGYRNIMPNSQAFETAFKTLLINNLSSPHSLQANCEKDDNICLQSLKSFLYNDINITKTSSEENAEIHVPNEYFFELINTQKMLESHSRADVEKCAAIAYCSGWIATKAKKIIFKKCLICTSNLISASICDFHKYIIKKEYCGKRWLCYPTRALFDFFAQVEHITNTVLNNDGHKKKLAEFITFIISINIELNFSNYCNEHHATLNLFLFEKSVLFFILNWCKEVSNVLNGKSFFNLIDINENEADRIFLQAREYFNKTKGRKRRGEKCVQFIVK